jgi:hypothetical protein
VDNVLFSTEQISEERQLEMVCSRRRQLLADYLERVQALAVEMELLLRNGDKQPEEEAADGWYRVEQAPQEVKIVLVRDKEAAAGWLRVEEARIQSDIARLALETHMANHRC